MAKTTKSKASLWYGYLKAGDRSGPVLQDARLDTGNSATLYMYNHLRGEIIEYARAIVEKKLRELNEAESGFIAELDAGYKKARRNFKARGAGIRNIPERGGPAPQKEEAPGDENDVSDIITVETDLLLDTEGA